jgi:peptidoglycan/xylan/chitin deacetylase (PgdA/CDA1 family)
MVPGVLVLMYHRIAREAFDPDGLCVSPETFEGQVATLRRLGVRLLTARQLADAVRKGQVPRRSAVITFDDGYVDNLTNAVPVLERHAAPATVFVVAGQTGSGREFWWDSLCRVSGEMRDVPPALPVVLGGEERLVTFERGGAQVEDTPSAPSSHAGRHALYRRLRDAVTAAPPRERDAIATALLVHAGLPAEARDSHRAMTADELRRLGAGGLVEIGAHSWSHPPLPLLTPDEQREELVGSRAALELILGAPVDGFAYPHGRFTAQTATLVREAGFAYACSSIPKLARRGSDLFSLPRVVVEDWPIERFEHVVKDYLRV